MAAKLRPTRFMLNGLRYTVRQLLKSPGFTIVAILTIGLGVGANTAVFSVTNAILLRFLPVPNPQELVLFHLRNQPLHTFQSGYDDTSQTFPVFQAMQSRRDVFTDVIAFAPISFGKIPVRFGGEPEFANGELVSGNFFSGLGIQPFFGRGFTREDESHSAQVAVLSHRWWANRFNSSRSVLGQTLYVKGVPFEIAGVAPPGFDGADPGQPKMDFWIPLQRNPSLLPWANTAAEYPAGYQTPQWLCFIMIGRLRPGISATSAAAVLTPLYQRTLAHAAPADPKDKKPELVLSGIRGIATMRENYEHPLTILTMLVGLVLLIASANVAMLLLLRNAAKEREYALRRALGAGARALFTQLISESLLLVAAACVIAWLFAGSAILALTRWSGLNLIIEPDRNVLLFTVSVSTVIALVFGLLPMRVVSNIPLAVALKSSAATSHTDRRRFWGRKLVVTLQISLCVVLLFTGELLYATLRNLESRNLGMRAAGVLVFGITPESGVRTDADAIRLHLRILQALQALPGVESATMSVVRFGAGGSYNDGVLVDGRNPLPDKPIAPMRVNLVGPDFLHTLGIPLNAGRDFTDTDILSAKRLAIVNQTFADRYLPHANPLGHQIAYFETPNTTYTIVGVARNSRYTAVKETDRAIVFFPFTQVPGVSSMQYEIRAAGDPNAIWPAAMKAVRAVDANLPLEKPVTQREQFEETISQERLVARLSLSFSALAVLLVLIGLYGTISYSVGRRASEIGVRIALGARGSEILAMVLREGALLAVAGVAIGLPAAFIVARLLRSMLFGLTSTDPFATVAALVGIAVVTVIATILPARRAAAIDPMRALRAE